MISEIGALSARTCPLFIPHEYRGRNEQQFWYLRTWSQIRRHQEANIRWAFDSRFQLHWFMVTWLYTTGKHRHVNIYLQKSVGHNKLTQWRKDLPPCGRQAAWFALSYPPFLLFWRFSPCTTLWVSSHLIFQLNWFRILFHESSGQVFKDCSVVADIKHMVNSKGHGTGRTAQDAGYSDRWNSMGSPIGPAGIHRKEIGLRKAKEENL